MCNRIWNRDLNASLNIHLIAKLAIQNVPRPAYLSRVRDEDNNNNKKEEQTNVKALGKRKISVGNEKNSSKTKTVKKQKLQ